MPTTRSVLGFLVLLTAVGVLIVIAALAVREPKANAANPSVLVYRVPETIDEAAPTHRVFGLPIKPRPTVEETVRALDRARQDSRVEALVLHVESLNWGWGRLAEIRDAVSRFRDTGRPVYASLEWGGEPEFFLASAASHISMPPTVTLNLDGLTASALFLRGALDKLDVHPNFAHAGRYKSGVETYTNSRMSEPSREALEDLLDDTFAVLIDTLAAARSLSPDSVRALIDAGPRSAAEAHAAGLIDTVLYAGDVDSLAEHRAGGGTERLSLARYVARGGAGQGVRIAYIAGSGTIASGRSRVSPTEGDVLGSETFIDAVDEARRRSSIRAVVLRVDSPGGAVEAADAMWHAVRRCAAEKPVIVSMSDYAASGGYYISAPAQHIVTQPGTITGSIGVYGGKMNLLGLMQKLGLNIETVSRGRFAEMLSPYRDFTPEEAARYQQRVDDNYRTFLERVVEGREIEMSWADSVGQGRVWSGRSAVELGLADTLGGIPLAFKLALDEAGYEPDADFAVEVIPRIERSFLDRMIENWLAEDEEREEMAMAGMESLSPVLRAWIAAARFPSGSVLALLPWSIQIR